MNPGQFTIRRSRAEQALIAMKWRRTMRRRDRRANRSRGPAQRSYAQLLQENLAAVERACNGC